MDEQLEERFSEIVETLSTEFREVHVAIGVVVHPCEPPE